MLRTLLCRDSSAKSMSFVRTKVPNGLYIGRLFIDLFQLSCGRVTPFYNTLFFKDGRKPSSDWKGPFRGLIALRGQHHEHRKLKLTVIRKFRGHVAQGRVLQSLKRRVDEHDKVAEPLNASLRV